MSRIIVLASGDPETLRSGLAWAAAYAAHEERLILLFEGEALVRLARQQLDTGASPEVDSPASLLEALREIPSTSIYVCPTAARAVGVTATTLEPLVDSVESLSTLIRLDPEAQLMRF